MLTKFNRMAKKESSGFSLQNVIQKYSAEKELDLKPTGIRVIDKIMGGGICPGSMYGFWGEPGAGKSTIALQIMKSFLRRGEKCLMIDVETAMNTNQQEAYGLRQFVEEGLLIHTTASTYVEAHEITMACAKDKEADIKFVLVDSETMLQPKCAEDIKIDDNQPGQKARQASAWLTATKQNFFAAGITSMIIFHARANISMTANPYAPAYKQAGGYAAKHIPDLIIQVQAGQKFGDKTTPDGQIVHITTDKNKFAAPFQKYDAKLFFGVGIKKSVDLIDEAIALGIIQQRGSFFVFGDQTVRGTEALYSMSTENLRELKKLVDETVSQ